MNIIPPFILLFLILHFGYSYSGVVASINKYSTAIYDCVKGKGYLSATIKVGSNEQDLMNQDVQNAFNSANAGLPTNIIFLPCRGNDYRVEAQKIKNTFQNRLFERVWLAADGGQSPICSWKIDDGQRTCDYMRNLAYTLKNDGYRIGVAVSKQTWQNFFNGQCGGLDSIADLFWIKFDNEPNFDSYKQIGGWITPIVKMYKREEIVCGVSLELTYSLI